MSNVVTVDIDIDAEPERVFDFMLDPSHLDEWVTIHRKVNAVDSGGARKGFWMEQTLCLRHANFKVKWELTEYERPSRATWQGRGPAGSHARTSYVVRARDRGGAHVEYQNEFKAPGGFLGAAASRALMGGVPEREANASLRQLKELLERGG